MKRKDILKEIIVQNQNKNFDFVLPRQEEVPLSTGKIITISGVRRCGKTHLLYHTINQLQNQKVDKSRILYLNFEDERLSLKTEELDLVIQSYMELYPELDLQNSWFFFDEIQNVPDWEKFIRRLYDTITRNIFISGSNSRMLSAEIATSLRGRGINIEIFPLSFKEFLQFKKIDTNYYLPQNKAKLLNSLKEFIVSGSFPEAINSNFRQKILQDYYYVLLYKDLIERYKISNISALKYFLSRLVLNTGKPASINKIHNELKSAGYKVSKDSLYAFAEYAEAVYFLFRVNKFDYSLVRQENAERKMYFIDNGLLNSLSFQFSDNIGTLLENAVYLHLRRFHNKNIFFFKEQQECAFVVFEKDKIIDLIQVSYDISQPETLKREISGLEKACQYFNVSKGKIITFDQDADTIKMANNIEIEVIPALKYFLGY